MSTWSDLYGADPNFTIGMDAARYLTHNRGECPDDMPCALCLLEQARAALDADRERLATAVEALAAEAERDPMYDGLPAGLHAAARIIRERP